MAIEGNRITQSTQAYNAHQQALDTQIWQQLAAMNANIALLAGLSSAQ
jgi:hypothetical protein